MSRACILLFAAAMMCLGLTACGRNAAGGMVGTACVSGVSAVNAGTAGSLYIQDNRGIVHYSAKGKLLARFGPSRGDWTVDGTGDVYYLKEQDIVKVSPSGTVISRWPAPKVEPEAVNDANGDVLAVYGGSNYAGTGPDAFELFSSAGKIIHRWSPSFDASGAFDTHGDFVTSGQTNAQLDAVNPVTGHVVAVTPPTLGSPYGVVGSDNRGHLLYGRSELHRYTVYGRASQACRRKVPFQDPQFQ